MADIEKIIDKAVNGDSNACNELYKLSCRWVYFTCYEILKNEKDAEDITQETYLTALQKLSGLKERKYFRSWICKIAINKCRKFLIKNGPAILEEEPKETDNELPDEEIILPDEYVENEEKRAIIMNIITNSLSDVQRQTIILYYYNQLTVAEIAEEMDCPVGTVTYRLSSAKKIIRKEVLRYEETNNESLRLTVPVPLLTRLLNAEADNHPLPDSDILKFALPSPLKTLPTVPDISLASTLTSTVTKILSAKSLAVISSVVIGGGGLGYYFYDSNNSENFTDVISEEKISSATENTIASDNFIFTQNTERVSSDTVNTAVVSVTEKTSLTMSENSSDTNILTSGTMALVTKPSFLTTSAETTSTKTTSSAVSTASSVKTTVTATTKTLTTAKTKTTTVSLTETAVNTTSAVTSATATTTAVTEVLSEAVTTVLPLNASYAGEKIDISYGFSHKAYIDLDGTLYMSGSNENGQLGDGTTEDRTEAVAVMEDVSFKSVSLGKYHSAAIAEDGSLYMWGLN
ncbi:MAG: sigma-70 family RNA polymerase sigma factor, partial [Oscillospiraceae bacterium]|nr:sigma-70 family RNA polymerase sigma factor [Oscillospiraceae bacterium]